jgi:hypothetical protein
MGHFILLLYLLHRRRLNVERLSGTRPGGGQRREKGDEIDVCSFTNFLVTGASLTSPN